MHQILFLFFLFLASFLCDTRTSYTIDHNVSVELCMDTRAPNEFKLWSFQIRNRMTKMRLPCQWPIENLSFICRCAILFHSIFSRRITRIMVLLWIRFILIVSIHCSNEKLFRKIHPSNGWKFHCMSKFTFFFLPSFCSLSSTCIPLLSVPSIVSNIMLHAIASCEPYKILVESVSQCRTSVWMCVKCNKP